MWKKIGIISVIIFFLTLILALVTVWQEVDFIVTSLREGNSLIYLTPQDLALPSENFTVKIRDERTDREEEIAGWFIPGQRDIVIIFVPGWGGNKRDFLFERNGFSPLRELWRIGFSLCLFDPRGLGSKEHPFALGIKADEDIKAVIDFLIDYKKIKKFILFGFSAGANAAIRVAMEKKEVVATIVDSPFVSIFNTKKYPKLAVHLFYFLSWFKLGIDWAKRFDLSQKDLGQLSNIFLVAGEKDTIAPPEEARFIFQRAKEPKELWIVEEADHCQAILLYPRQYLQRIIRFLVRILAKGSSFC